jgi:hypothetical protein
MSRHDADRITLASLGVALGLGLASPADAALVEVDLDIPGDGLITRDTDSGLDWLDLKVTSGLSYDDVSGGAGGWITDGWRYAVSGELCELLQTHAFFFAPCPSVLVATSDGDQVTGLIALLSETDPIANGARTIGLFDDGDPTPTVGISSVTYSGLQDRSLWDVVVDDQGSSFFDLTIGSWLVRPSPAVSVDTSAPPIPALVTLAQNAPNPFASESIVRFRLGAPTRVELAVFDVAGRHVVDLLRRDSVESGAHSIVWNGTDHRGARVSPGVYIYRLRTAHGELSRRMLVTE